MDIDVEFERRDVSKEVPERQKILMSSSSKNSFRIILPN